VFENETNQATPLTRLVICTSRTVGSAKNCQTKNLPDSDPDLTSSSLVTFGPNFDCILLHIQNFTVRRMLNVK
jgi:hypothetical protein